MTWIPDDLVKECQQGKCRRKFAKVCQLFADGAGSAFFFFFFMQQSNALKAVMKVS